MTTTPPPIGPPRLSNNVTTVDIVVMRSPDNGGTPYPVTITVEDARKAVLPTFPDHRFYVIPSQDQHLNDLRVAQGKIPRAAYSLVVAPFGMTIASSDKRREAMSKGVRDLAALNVTPEKLTRMIADCADRAGLKGE